VGSVEELGLPPALSQTLRDNGLTTAAAIAKKNPRELQLFRGVGPGAVGRIAQALDAEDLKLAADPFAPYVCARHGGAKLPWAPRQAHRSVAITGDSHIH
jgi:hypothetical protein